MLGRGLVDEAWRTAWGAQDVTYSRGFWFRTPEAYDIDGNYRASLYLRPLAIWAIEYAIRQRAARRRGPCRWLSIAHGSTRDPVRVVAAAVARWPPSSPVEVRACQPTAPPMPSGHRVCPTEPRPPSRRPRPAVPTAWRSSGATSSTSRPARRPNPEHWGYALGDGTAESIAGWGNNELECVHGRPDERSDRRRRATS